MRPLAVGDEYSFEHQFDLEQVRRYARLTGDDNPLHVDPDYAAGTRFGRCIVHGMFVAGLISRALGKHLPGPGSIYMGQTLSFQAPVYADDRVRVSVTVLELQGKRRTRIATRVTRADGELLLEGEAMVKAPRDESGIAMTHHEDAS